ncbi:hypothetical protein, partial [Bacillus safensis]|uniref:hypothetical protein n=1 Tax=Bacillus safensis TaxID=561879 RepID=UPI001F1AE72F
MQTFLINDEAFLSETIIFVKIYSTSFKDFSICFSVKPSNPFVLCVFAAAAGEKSVTAKTNATLKKQSFHNNSPVSKFKNYFIIHLCKTKTFKRRLIPSDINRHITPTSLKIKTRENKLTCPTL